MSFIQLAMIIKSLLVEVVPAGSGDATIRPLTKQLVNQANGTVWTQERDLGTLPCIPRQAGKRHRMVFQPYQKNWLLITIVVFFLFFFTFSSFIFSIKLLSCHSSNKFHCIWNCYVCTHRESILYFKYTPTLPLEFLHKSSKK